MCLLNYYVWIILIFRFVNKSKYLDLLKRIVNDPELKRLLGEEM